MRRLPPFAELVAFEALARHLSFTRAASELCLTQSAISHRIRRLEQHFGERLVHRAPGGLALTAAGAALLPDLSAALDQLARLRPSAARVLRVAAGSALCNHWLAGRLPAFQALHPGVSVELIALENDRDTIPECDLRILWLASGEQAARPRQAELFVESVFPVCSPRLLPGGMPLTDPARLAGLPLLHKASGGAGEWRWPVWFERLGIAAAPAASALRFADMAQLMSAALDGAGVALSRSLLVHDALASGRLVPALAAVPVMTSSKVHVARWPAALAQDPLQRAFIDWLLAQARECLANTERMLGGPVRAVGD